MRLRQLATGASALVLAFAHPAFAQQPEPTPADALKQKAVADSLGRLEDNSWPYLTCQTDPAVIKRRVYYDFVEEQYRNANGLIEEQQRLADALACQREPDLVFRTGVDFTSADAFSTQNADFRASIAYNVNVGGTRFWPVFWAYRVSRLALNVRAERVSTLVQRNFYDCAPTTVTGPLETRSTLVLLPGACALPTSGSDSLSHTVYAPVAVPLRPTEYDVQGAWSASGLLRWETPLFINENIFAGPAVEWGFMTDPTGGSSRGLQTHRLYGLSFRQISGSTRLERFSLLALWGNIHQFRQHVQTYDDDFVEEHPEVALIPGAAKQGTAFEVPVGLEARRRGGMVIRMMFQPLPDDMPRLFIRGAVELPDGGRSSSSLAFLIQGDIPTILRGLGIRGLDPGAAPLRVVTPTDSVAAPNGVQPAETNSPTPADSLAAPDSVRLLVPTPTGGTGSESSQDTVPQTGAPAGSTSIPVAPVPDTLSIDSSVAVDTATALAMRSFSGDSIDGCDGDSRDRCSVPRSVFYVYSDIGRKFRHRWA